MVKKRSLLSLVFLFVLSLVLLATTIYSDDISIDKTPREIKFDYNSITYKNPDNTYTSSIYFDAINLDKIVNVTNKGDDINIKWKNYEVDIILNVKEKNKEKIKIGDLKNSNLEYVKTIKAKGDEYEFFWLLNDTSKKSFDLEYVTIEVVNKTPMTIIAENTQIIMGDGLYIDLNDLVDSNYTLSKLNEKEIKVESNAILGSTFDTDSILLDPTVRINVSMDNYIRGDTEQFKSYNYGAATSVSINYPGTLRTLMYFPLTSIPANASISEALLYLRAINGPTTSANISTYPLLKSWNEGTSSAGANSAFINGSTWMERWYGDNKNDGCSGSTDPDWCTNGTGVSDYNASLQVNNVIRANAGGTWVNLSMLTYVNKSVHGEMEWYGIVFWTNTSASSGYQFASRQYTTVTTYRPYVNITYSLPSPITNLIFPVNNTNTSNGLFNFTCNASIDSSLPGTNITKLVIFYSNDSAGVNWKGNMTFNETSGITAPNKTIQQNWSTTLTTNGVYYWGCAVNVSYGGTDSSGLVQPTAPLRFIFDNIGPNVTYQAPTPDGGYVSSVVINVSVNDSLNAIDTCILQWNSTTALTNYTMTKSTGYCNYTMSVTTGTYYFKVYANDSLGNLGNASLRNFTFDNTPPSINVTYPLSRVYMDLYSYSLGLNVTASDVGSSLQTFKYSLNGAANTTFTPNITLTTLVPGLNNLTVYVNDSAGNINSSSVNFTLRFTPKINNTIIGNSSTNYSRYNLTNGLVGWWKFDEITNNIAYDTSLYRNNATLFQSMQNLLVNGDFESGTWANAGDCCCASCSCVAGSNCSAGGGGSNCTCANGGTCYYLANVATDKINGDYSLNLTGNKSCACNNKAMSSFTINKTYTLSFWYKDVSGPDSPRYCMWISGRNVCDPAETISVSDNNWHYYQKSFKILDGTTAAALYLYGGNGATTESTNLYDDVRIVEGPGWDINGKIGNALFVAVNNATIPHIPAYNFTGGFSMSYWVKFNMDMTSSNPSVAQRLVNKNNQWINYIGTDSRNLRFYLNNGTTWEDMSLWSSKTSWNKGQWYLVTYTVSARTNPTITLYIDGSQDSTTSKTGTWQTSRGNITIGYASEFTTGELNGTIDELRFYNYSLTATQVRDLYQVTNPTFQESSNTTITVTIIDEDSPASSLYYQWFVGPVSVLSGLAQSVFNYVFTQPSTNVYLIINDSNNYQVFQNWTINTTYDNPTISYVLPTPSDSSVQTGTTVTINVSANDTSGIDKCILQWNSTSSINNYTMTRSGIYCNYTVSIATPGYYYFKVYANDTLGNWFNESLRTILKNSPPVQPTVTIIPATAYKNSTLNCTANTTDVDGHTISYFYQFLTTNGTIVQDYGYTAPTEYCYQETANISTACGGLDTGKYWYTTDTTTNYNYINYSKPSFASNNSLWHVKYSRTANVTVNYTIPSSCWEQSTLTMYFYLSGTSGSASNMQFGCKNATGLVAIEGPFSSTTITRTTTGSQSELYDGNWDNAISYYSNVWYRNAVTAGGGVPHGVFEEAMYWAREGSSNLFDCNASSLCVAGENITCNVKAYDGYENSTVNNATRQISAYGATTSTYVIDQALNTNVGINRRGSYGRSNSNALTLIININRKLQDLTQFVDYFIVSVTIENSENMFRRLSQSININVLTSRMLNLQKIVSQSFSIDNFVNKLRSVFSMTTQSIALTENIDSILSGKRFTTQNINVVDDVGIKSNFKRSNFLSMTINNFANRLLKLFRIETQSILLYENESDIFSGKRLVNQSINITDSTFDVYSGKRMTFTQLSVTALSSEFSKFFRVSDDEVSFFDDVTYNLLRRRFVYQNLSFLDTTGREYFGIRNIDQIIVFSLSSYKPSSLYNSVSLMIGVSESIYEKTAMKRVLEDLLEFIDSINRKLFGSRVINDVINVNEDMSRRTLLLRLLTNGISVGDSVNIRLFGSRVISQEVNINDDIFRQSIVSKDITERVNISIVNNRTYLGNRITIDFFSIDDLIRLRFMGIRYLNQDINIFAIKLTGGSSIFQSIIELLEFNDYVSRTAMLSRVSQISLLFNDITNRIAYMFLGQTVTIDFSDSVVRQGDVHVLMSDNIEFDDFLSRSLNLIRNSYNGIYINNIVNRITYLFVDNGLGINFYDSIERLITRNVFVSQDITFYDSVARLNAFVRNLYQILVFNENIPGIDVLYQFYLEVRQDIFFTANAQTISDISKEFYDIITLNNDVVRFAFVSRGASDSVEIFDNIDTMLDIFRKPNEIVSFSIITNRLSSMTLHINIILDINELSDRIAEIYRIVSVPFNIFDYRIRTFFGLSSLNDSFIITSENGRTYFGNRIVDETFDVDIMTLRIATLSRLIVDSITIVTATTVTAVYVVSEFFVTIVQQITINDIVSRATNLYVIFIDVISVIISVVSGGGGIIGPGGGGGGLEVLKNIPEKIIEIISSITFFTRGNTMLVLALLSVMTFILVLSYYKYEKRTKNKKYRAIVIIIMGLLVISIVLCLIYLLYYVT